MGKSKHKWRPPTDVKNIVIGILPKGEEICIGKPMRIVVFPDREKLKEANFGTCIPATIQETSKVTWYGIPNFSDLWKVQTASGRTYYVMQNGGKDMGLVKNNPPRTGKEMVMYTVSLQSPTNLFSVFCQQASGQMPYNTKCIDGGKTWKVEFYRKAVIVQVV